MSGEIRSILAKPPRTRSRVSNGKILFGEADGRSVWARRYRDLAAAFVQDAGGIEQVTELKLGLIRRAAALAVECERMESRLAEGDQKVDIDLLARMSSHLRRIAETIGLAKVKIQKPATLKEIVETTRTPRGPL